MNLRILTLVFADLVDSAALKRQRRCVPVLPMPAEDEYREPTQHNPAVAPRRCDAEGDQ